MSSTGYIGIGVCATVLAALCWLLGLNGTGGVYSLLLAALVSVIAQFLLLVGVIGYGVALGLRDSGATLTRQGG